MPDEAKVAELQALVDSAAPAEAPVALAEPAAPVGQPMNRDKPELPAYVLAALSVVAITVLTLTGHAVPDILNVATIGALGIGGAVTTPGGSK